MLNVDHISSRQNPLVKRFRDAAREPGRDGLVLLDGAHLVEEALSAGVPIDVAAFAEPPGTDARHVIRARAAAAGTRFVTVSPQVLAAMSPVREPSGVVALAQLTSTPLDQVSTRAPQLLVILVALQDPGNVGALIRTAEACSATGVVATAGTASPFGWKALRGAMGSAFRLPIATHVDSTLLVRELRARGIALLAAVPRGGTPLPECRLTAPTALLLGGEGGGVPAELVESADLRVSIPMCAPVESLNVAIAGSLILYEAARQRGV
jgi:RNA methyltransferase, TrmH family